MTLIKSISGIRGTIGGQTGDTLNPLDIVKFTTEIPENPDHPAKSLLVATAESPVLWSATSS